MSPTVVADAVVWLVSDEGRNITGIELPVDGGHLVLPGFNHDTVVEEIDADRDGATAVTPGVR